MKNINQRLNDLSDTAFFCSLLILSNLHLFGIGSIGSVIFDKKKVAAGELYRLITFSFAHVTWYHFLLDASAFLFLYSALASPKKGIRLLHVIASGGMSLLVSVMFAPGIDITGLCGLSGVGHGLFMIVSLEMMRSSDHRLPGILCGGALILKCCIEMTSGNPVFGFVHGDLIGKPVLICHLGGVLGGLLSYSLVSILKEKKQVVKLGQMIALFLLISLLPESLSAMTEERTALVIGNSRYGDSDLKNPVNDAQDIARKLRKLGFSVDLKVNTPRREMETAIQDFGQELKKGGVGLFFYAGHAVQIKSENYLIPTGATIRSESDIRYEAVHAGRILSAMHSAKNGLNIVILDACRDNPFGSNYQTAVYRSFNGKSRGLARMDAPKGTLIAYSTSPGRVAADGEGRNSPYTDLLLQNMTIANIPVEQVFKRIRRSIDKRTDGRQIPWESTSLTNDFYFNPKGVKKQSKVPVAGNVTYLTQPGIPEINAPVLAPSLSFSPPVTITSNPTRQPGIDSVDAGSKYLKLKIVNETGYPIPYFTVNGGPVSVNGALGHHAGSTQTVFSKRVPPGNYTLEIGARYGYTLDDLDAGVPAVPTASRLFQASDSLFVASGSDVEKTITIKFQDSGFWETRNKEFLIFDFQQE